MVRLKLRSASAESPTRMLTRVENDYNSGNTVNLVRCYVDTVFTFPAVESASFLAHMFMSRLN